MAANTTYDEQANMQKLGEVLSRHNITIADANDLVLLQGYEIVIIADDSGSMSLSSVPQNQRRLGQREPSRWEELGGTLQMVVELATCFDKDGLDIFFLNRPSLHGIKSRDDPSLVAALAQPPAGGTPLTETLQNVIQKFSASAEKPVLVVIATDGVPNGGPHPLKNAIRSAVNRQSTATTFKFQILACTDDDSQVGWLNEFDAEFQAVDVTDDYHSEKQEVMRTGKCPTFNRGDWIIKALLGPISTKFDGWDERAGHHQPPPPQYQHTYAAPGHGPPPHQHKPQQAKKDDGCCTIS
eukprot:TRINITY_DN988_c0_g1_i5.p2 TRINITY_DN988_c0_g1~~TRINITY_DN988_c0_g1_i5.p2  ORF type:complete len:309 (+),score=125.37 TRINITY_DN988_c0_g1_i5:38-928(+)